MTRPFIPHVLRPLTASATRDPGLHQGAIVSFTVGADHYSFLLDRVALKRLGDQIDRVLRELPPKPRKVP